MKRKKLLGFLLILVLVMASFAACGGGEEPDSGATEGEAADIQEISYPEKTIKIIVPYSAGGNTDLLTRAVAEKMAGALGVSVVVENQTGGGGAVAINAMLAEDADGYTLCTVANGPVTITPIMSDVGYTTTELTEVCQIAEQANIFCIRKGLGISNWEEFVEYVKANPGVTYGTAGIGSYSNLILQTVFREAGIVDEMSFIPFDGGAAAVTAVLGDQVDGVITVPSEVSGYVNSGDFVPLLLLATDRSDAFPDTPTSAELGFTSPSGKGGTFTGFVARAEVDPQIVAKLEATIEEILKSDDIKELFGNLGVEPTFMNSADFTDRVLTDYKNNTETLKAMGLI